MTCAVRGKVVRPHAESVNGRTVTELEALGLTWPVGKTDGSMDTACLQMRTPYRNLNLIY